MMLKLLGTLRDEGEEAFRQAAWLMFAAILATLAAAFGGVALALAFAAAMPLWAALLVSGALIILLAGLCLLAAKARGPRAIVAAESGVAPIAATAKPVASLLQSGLIEQSAQALLMRQLQMRPVLMLAIAAAAGLAVSAFGKLDDD